MQICSKRKSSKMCFYTQISLLQIKRALFYETRRFLVHNNNSAAPIQKETAAAKALKLMILISLPFFQRRVIIFNVQPFFIAHAFWGQNIGCRNGSITTFRKCTWSCCSTLILFFNSYYKDTEKFQQKEAFSF